MLESPSDEHFPSLWPARALGIPSLLPSLALGAPLVRPLIGGPQVPCAPLGQVDLQLAGRHARSPCDELAALPIQSPLVSMFVSPIVKSWGPNAD
jgi:hypothetical protein